MAETSAARDALDEGRAVYRPLAAAMAALYIVMADLPLLSPMYQVGWHCPQASGPGQSCMHNHWQLQRAALHSARAGGTSQRAAMCALQCRAATAKEANRPATSPDTANAPAQE